MWYNNIKERDSMNSKNIQKIINETSFTMEVEGLILTPDEKDNIRKVLSGEIPFTAQLNKYIENAKHIGGIANATY